MEYILVGLFCFFAGYIWGGVSFIMKFKRILAAAQEAGVNVNENDLEKESIPILKTEKHGDTLYLFEKASDTFMCQGTTLEDLMNKLSEYKGIHLAFVEHESKGLWFVNGEITEHQNES